MFSSLQSSLNKMGQDITKGVDSFSRTVDRTFDENWSSPELDLFKSGNVIQLVSRSSGRTLQIVTAPTGQLVLDGAGPEGPHAFNAHWTVINEGRNVVKLHNNNNFICIVNGCTVVVNNPNPQMLGAEAKLRLSQTSNFMRLESVQESGRHVGILPNGQLKSALACGKEIDAQFGVRLIYTPYQPAAGAQGGQVTVVKTTVEPPPPYSETQMKK